MRPLDRRDFLVKTVLAAGAWGFAGWPSAAPQRRGGAVRHRHDRVGRAGRPRDRTDDGESLVRPLFRLAHRHAAPGLPRPPGESRAPESQPAGRNAPPRAGRLPRLRTPRPRPLVERRPPRSVRTASSPAATTRSRSATTTRATSTSTPRSPASSRSATTTTARCSVRRSRTASTCTRRSRAASRTTRCRRRSRAWRPASPGRRSGTCARRTACRGATTSSTCR